MTPLFGEPSAGGGGRALVHQGQNQVLGRNVFVLEAFGLLLRRVEQSGEALGDHHLAGGGARSGGARALGEIGFDGAPQRGRVGAGAGEQPGRQAVLLIEQRQKQMLPVDLVLAEPHRHALRFLQRFLGLLREAVHVHCVRSSAARWLRRSALSRRSIRSSRSSTTPTAA
ncbi:hypothetical protein GCM10018966_104170 [Streptomyces yanii]